MTGHRNRREKLECVSVSFRTLKTFRVLKQNCCLEQDFDGKLCSLMVQYLSTLICIDKIYEFLCVWKVVCVSRHAPLNFEVLVCTGQLCQFKISNSRLYRHFEQRLSFGPIGSHTLKW